MAAHCKLCADLASQSDRAAWNRPLIETSNFVVLPSLGALVEGWLLTVPKDHHLSMGSLPIELRAEADQVEATVRLLLSTKYQRQVITFEHGPSAAKHGTGCGVDHAHLHSVPLDCDLLEHVAPFLPRDVSWKPGDWHGRGEASNRGLDYLYLKQEGQSGLLAVCEDFGSQIFRKAISAYLGKDSQYSWRQYPQFENVAKTITAVTLALPSAGPGSNHVS